MLIPSVTRWDLLTIAKASLSPMTPAMQRFVNELLDNGIYAVATQNELEFFDELLDDMEEQS